MTKKDYEIIAGQFKKVMAVLDTEISTYSNANMPTLASIAAGNKNGVTYAAAMLAISFELNNPRFDRTKFMAACGINEGGRNV